MMHCSAFKLQQCNRFADVKFGFEFQRSRAMHNSKCACICTNNTHLYCIHCIASGALRLRAKRRTYKIACHLQSVWISLHNKPDSFYSVLHYFYFHSSPAVPLSSIVCLLFCEYCVELHFILLYWISAFFTLLPLLFFRWLRPSSPYRYRCIFSFFLFCFLCRSLALLHNATIMNQCQTIVLTIFHFLLLPQHVAFICILSGLFISRAFVQIFINMNYFASFFHRGNKCSGCCWCRSRLWQNTQPKAETETETKNGIWCDNRPVVRHVCAPEKRPEEKKLSSATSDEIKCFR